MKFEPTHVIDFPLFPAKIKVSDGLVVEIEKRGSTTWCPRCMCDIVGNWRLKTVEGVLKVKCPTVNCDSWDVTEIK